MKHQSSHGVRVCESNVQHSTLNVQRPTIARSKFSAERWHSLILLVLSSVVCPLSSSSQVPSLINYQGRLVQGTNLVNGVTGLTIRLYNAPAAGTLLYEDSGTVSVVDGLYSTFIGDQTNAGNLVSALTNAQVYLGVAVNGGPELSPRERVVTVAYSLATRGWLVTAGASPNLVGGPDANNHVAASINGAFIGGGYGNLVNVNAASIGGGGTNTIASGAAYGHIGGGRNNTIALNAAYAAIGGGDGNTIEADSSAAIISGGVINDIGGNSDNSVIAGGYDNNIDGVSPDAAIGGGIGNLAGGIGSTVPGGSECVAGNTLTFAAGNRAKADHVGAFVLSDSSPFDFNSSVADQFNIRAVGGTRIVSGIDGFGAIASGVEVASGGGSWTSLSDVNAKENFRDVDPREVLDKVAALPVREWNYKTQDDTIRHLGPTAQDFHRAFGIGESETGITGVDADGVALAAIQALNADVTRLREEASAWQGGQKSEVRQLREENIELRRELDAIKERLNAIDAR
jgi:hypothetical protein